MSLTQPGRPQPVVEIPFTTSDQKLADLLQRTLGRLVSLQCVSLFAEDTPTAVGTAGSTLFIKASCAPVNWGDAGVDECRLVGYGASSDPATTLRYMDFGAAVTYCAVTNLPAVAGIFTGPWTKATFQNADLSYGFRVDLALTKTCTLSRVELQIRSSHFQG